VASSGYRAGADPTARYEGEDLVDADYMLACPNGCFERGYLKRSKRIKQPWEYRCKECDTQLVSYDAGGPPGSIEPGHLSCRKYSMEAAS